jgi:serine/threonine-protein phosphatase 2A regulatory subunit B
MISAVEFDHTGDYLATGDHGGRVVLFERASSRTRPSVDMDARTPSPLHVNPYEYRYLTEFQSHEPEFDYLKSLEIEENINKIRWVKRWPGAPSHTILSANDKTVKLWKVYERKVTCLADFNLLENGSNSALTNNSGSSIGGSYNQGMHNNKNNNSGVSGIGPHNNINSHHHPGGARHQHPHLMHRPGFSPDKLTAAATAAAASSQAPFLRLPKIVSSETLLATKCRRTFANAHTYHINSLALSSDSETFISADDLRINLWHLDRNDAAFCIVDIKPDSMEDLTEVITAADFHPKSCSIFVYASSKGCLRLADLRSAALCDQSAKIFEDSTDQHGVNKSFFAEIITSINDAKFSACGQYILARDYMTLKLWDVRMETKPIVTHAVHDPLKDRFCDLYENDCIFDKFDCCMSGDGQYMCTGSYSNFFRVVGRDGGGDTLLEASRDPMRRRISTADTASNNTGGGGGRFGYHRGGASRNGGSTGADCMGAEEMLTSDFSSKTLHMSWHPEANVVATAASNSLYLFYGRSNRF